MNSRSVALAAVFFFTAGAAQANDPKATISDYHSSLAEIGARSPAARSLACATSATRSKTHRRPHSQARQLVQAGAVFKLRAA